MITDKEHLFNSNMLFCLPCTPYTLVLMSYWLSSFPQASDLIITSIALFKNRHYHFIILFLRLNMYHCFTVLCCAVSVFWQFSVASCLNISNLCSALHLKIQDTLALWLSGTSWAQQTCSISWLKASYNTYWWSSSLALKILYDPLDRSNNLDLRIA